MDKKRRNIIYGAIAAAFIVLATYVLLRPDAVAVETAIATRGPMQVTVDGEGKTRVQDRFVVAAPVNGKLQRISLKRGDEIKTGDLVAKINAMPLSPLDPRQSSEATSRVGAAESAKSEAEANLARVQTELEQARRDRERSKNIMDYGRVSQEDYERKLTAERTLENDLAAAKARVRSAEQRISQSNAIKKEAEANVARINGNLQQAKREVQRTASLYEGGIVSRQEYEQKQLNYETAGKELDAAKYRLEVAETDIGVAKESLAEAKTNAAHVEQDLAQARRETVRAKNVLTYGKTPQQDYEQRLSNERRLEKELDAARFRVQTAENEISRAGAQLLRGDADGESTPVYAPADGKVLKILEESERVVNAGTPLIELSNPSNLEIVVDVLSSDAVKIKTGDLMLISGWGENESATARVRLIEPSAFTKVSSLGIEEQRVNIIGDFVERPSSVGDGYRVDAKFVVWQSSEVLKVPSSSLFRKGEGWSVFAVEDNRAKQRDVTVGQRNADEAEILSGLDAGIKVILHPTNDLQDGVAISDGQ